MKLIFNAHTEKEADRFEQIIDDSDFYCERFENSFIFVEENSLDSLEKVITDYIINPNDIDGYFESEE